jgi:V/A-type H+-transporting ATPase subunit I
MKNPKFLSPFEMLVTNYAVPEYGTVDPTPIVAVAYLMMFGLMFGDAGHGLVIALIGLLGNFLTRNDGESGVHKIFQLMIWCGLSAIITGILFGSYFGHRLFQPLWFDYHGIIAGHDQAGLVKDIYGILLITIYFGIAIIGIGLLLNWINCISKGHWFKLFMDKGGLIGGWMYGAGVYASFFFVSHEYKSLPESNTLFLLLGLPALLFTLKPPLEFMLHNKKHPHNRAAFRVSTLLNFMMEWLVEMLEIFSGYLANTLSFMRVAGLGIAHVSLMIAFDQIAGMITGGKSGFNIWALLVLLAGNVLVIGLEGLSAGIQSLRLNYYEFFSKYFSGTGKVYSPISLKGNN